MDGTHLGSKSIHELVVSLTQLFQSQDQLGQSCCENGRSVKVAAEDEGPQGRFRGGLDRFEVRGVRGRRGRREDSLGRVGTVGENSGRRRRNRFLSELRFAVDLVGRRGLSLLLGLVE